MFKLFNKKIKQEVEEQLKEIIESQFGGLSIATDENGDVIIKGKSNHYIKMSENGIEINDFIKMSENGIEINNKESIKIKAKEIIIESEKINIDGNDVLINADNRLSVEGSSTDIGGNVELVLNAGVIKVS
jgi:hypothetical protein